ncbi:uncharacterized protein LOC9647846 [Selaginella moellendorffii]|nr:uncharacterized protein LOC9647846 [Selaginella moellendorffii]|eukprot:XP_002980186.2 uncharacterized protein LOC9647846 [Selaginella moellendorffii]
MALFLHCIALPRFQNLQLQGAARWRGAWIARCSLSSAAADPGDELWERKKRSRSIAGVDQAVLMEPWLLADPSSRFAEYNGVQVHYKIIARDGSPGNISAGEAGEFPAILLHGFGASIFSWERLMQPLAKVLASTVVAFDRPGFGLTSRPRIQPSAAKENPYSLDFSASITAAFIDFLGADKVILVGHSAGCIVAADTYFKAPERIAGIVMLAPAIAAPFMGKLRRRQRRETRKEEHLEPNPLSRARLLVKLVTSLFLGLRAVALELYSKLKRFTQSLKELVANIFAGVLAAALRSKAAIWMIQQIMDRYSREAVRFAWYNPQMVDNSIIQGYTKPLGCRNWDQALLEYVIAMLSTRDKKGRKLAEKIEEISCPVLIVTGDTDRLVPAWNAEKLAKVFPKSTFHKIKECGHLPHEETPEEVLRVVGEFISSSIAKVKCGE